jgi:hypothetical protein
MISLSLATASSLQADINKLPPGYSIQLASSNVSASSIPQLAFKPGDLIHVYAARTSPSRVTRYDYNPVTGRLSNPFTVATNVDNREMYGIGFHGTNLYVTFDYGGSLTVRPGDGRISRFMFPDSNGVYRVRHDFVHSIDKGYHDLNQIQINGDSLYVGIGAAGRRGDPTVENLYTMTIARVVDLNQIVTDTNVLINFKGPTNYLANPVEWLNTNGTDGQLRYYASGFRNPFGLAFDPDGDLWISVNGNNEAGFFSDDLVYKKLPLGAQGDFPPAAFGFTNYITGTPFAPFLSLGVSPSPTGFDFILDGPDAGKILMGEAGAILTNWLGRDLLLIDQDTGSWQQIYQFSTNAPTSAITDVVRDPFGRFLIADYGRGNIWLLTPPLPRPTLEALVTNDQFRLSWPLTGVEYQLEESPDLTVTNGWQMSSIAVQVTTNGIQAQVAYTNMARFFRLKK